MSEVVRGEDEERYDDPLTTGRTLADKLGEDLSGIADVRSVQCPGLEGKEMIEIRVTDKEKWQSEDNLRNLFGPFGEVLFDAYRDRDDSAVFREDDPKLLENFLDRNRGEAHLSPDTIYAVAERGRVIGSISSRDFQFGDGMCADEVILTGVVRDYEATGLGGQLYKLMLGNTRNNMLVAISHTPAAVKNGIKLGNEAGWRVYFCGLRDGDPNKPMTDVESNMLRKIEEGMRAKVAKNPYIGHFQEGLPIHYVSCGDEGIPPRKLEELRFKDGDHLKGTFEDLIHWQMENRPEHSIYGIVVSLRGEGAGS